MAEFTHLINRAIKWQILGGADVHDVLQRKFKQTQTNYTRMLRCYYAI